ncbi:AMP-dependent synthetase/ligase [Polymorphum gilvum]|uniref:Acyl-CoA synthetase (AMP-forming) / AMP-acid ligase n=1 Tax=Polymorphum gilvum (strain LMG 25793 / CGMCC 1.9160 / SL003B-26A1) TaxID=991905 RepID=F2IYR0_POLGS|nr:AMP-binding protein [Polymorphum gilvum]ADZ69507.1 Acyl-CoA synthetase (AMP-forming) / AMP-acid ligase [Polymorphum gilvum SL003B-26A1]
MIPTLMRAEPVAAARQSNGRTLPQILRDNAKDFATRPAIKSKRAGIWQAKTWADTFTLVLRAARGLAALGLRRDEVLALVSENIEEQLVLELAALAIGARTVSVYPDATADELGYVLTHARAAMVLGEDQEQVDKTLACLSDAPAVRKVIYVDGRGLWTYGDERLVSFGQMLRAGDGFAEDAWVLDELARGRQDDVAVYCYTSGTTGRPKAAMLSHAFILDNAYRLMGALEIQDGDNYLSYISPAWAAEQFFGVALPLLAPMVVHFAEKPETIQKDLREIGPEFLMFTPRQWEMQASGVEARMMDARPWQRRLYQWGLEQGRARARGRGGLLSRAVLWPLADQLVLKGIRDVLGLTRARAVLSGGAGLSAELFERYHAFGVPLGNLYGSSELGLISTHRPGRSNPQTMGALMPSDPSITDPMEAFVADDGELRLKVLAFSGYLDDDASTGKMGRADEGYRTGDAVRVDEAGELIFLDRIKDLRRLSNGQAYPPQFIENHLRASPLIRDAIVIGDENHDSVVALVNIDAEICGRFAEMHGLAFGTFPELSQLPAVREEIARAIGRVNALVDPSARIVAFANLPKELDADDSELTRSRKLRREQIHARYQAMIDALYRGEAVLRTDIEVKYQDGTTSVLSTAVALNRVGEPA